MYKEQDQDKVHHVLFVPLPQFCGSTIAGLSLLSDSVMRLVKENSNSEWLDLMLPRRSLYILRLSINKYTFFVFCFAFKCNSGTVTNNKMTVFCATTVWFLPDILTGTR